MAINPPVDATQTEAWAKLQRHYDEMQSEGIDLKKWFADDENRVDDLTFEAGTLHFDLSKNLIKPETLELFAELANEVNLAERTKQMYTGVHINNTEDRAVLHTALRRPVEDEGKYIVDGQDTVKDVRETLERMYAFAEKVRSGEWKGVTGKEIETVVNIGIGGSDLGPVMAYEALKPFADAGIKARYVSNIDPNDIAEKTRDLDPETTLFVVVSKTFGTLETLTNAREARAWLLEELTASHAIDGTEVSKAEAIEKHFVAVSTNLERVKEFGIDPTNAFGFWDWVGGRYSVDSAVGLTLAIVFGPARFEEFLNGFHQIDEYFANTPFEKNVVVLMGMLNVWYRNFFKVASHAVLPYDQYLHRFPAYLQQLTMESNGKSVRWDGTPGDHRDRRDLLGRARHQRPARVLPAHPPGHAADPGRLHRVRQHAEPAQGRRPGHARTAARQLLRADQGARVRQDRRRSARRGHAGRDCSGPRVHRQPPDHVDLRRAPRPVRARRADRAL